MRFDLDQVDAAITYKLLAATIVPRPIAWIVTKDTDGVLNAAPFSFFNAMGANPPIVAIGMTKDPRCGLKDSAQIILETGEFVVNLVPEKLVEAMNLTAINAPREIDELALAGLEIEQSSHISPPRIIGSPVSFECTTNQIIETGEKQLMVVGNVLAVHIGDEYVTNKERGHVDTQALELVGRAYGVNYVHCHDFFSLERPTWDSWQKGK